jgi:hypothetical protein
MLNGELVSLRARTADDAEILHEELYENVEDWVRGSNHPWVPIAPGPGSPYAAADPADDRRGPVPSAAEFSIVELDAVRVVCRYGFALRGLHRLQLETLTDNHAMIAVAEKLGFTREGATRGSSWMNSRFMDDVIFGLLAEEFSG